MAKLKSPLFSLTAEGHLSKALTYLRRRFSNIVVKPTTHKDRQSFAQLSWRHMYQKAVALWWALSVAERQSWESLARPFHMTGFAYFISQALKPNPGLYLPLQGGTMAGEIDMDGHRIEDLPDPTMAQDPVTRQYFEDNLPTGGYTEGARVYHNANQSIPNATMTTLAFNSEQYDTDTIHDNVVNNSRLTCKTAGKYHVSYHGRWGINAVGLRNVQLSLNGTVVMYHEKNAVVAPSSTTGFAATILDLSVNDYLEIAVYQNTGGAYNLLFVINETPYFMMQRIG